jgi:hypothetical protein
MAELIKPPEVTVDDDLFPIAPIHIPLHEIEGIYPGDTHVFVPCGPCVFRCILIVEATRVQLLISRPLGQLVARLSPDGEFISIENSIGTVARAVLDMALAGSLADIPPIPTLKYSIKAPYKLRPETGGGRVIANGLIAIFSASKA